jgi:hypothetical protein
LAAYLIFAAAAYFLEKRELSCHPQITPITQISCLNDFV